MAVGAAAMAAGLLPGPGDYTIGGGDGSGGRVETGDLPDLDPQGSPSASPAGRGAAPTARGAERTERPSGRAPGRASTDPSGLPSPRSGGDAGDREDGGTGAAPSRPASSAPAEPGTPPPGIADSAGSAGSAASGPEAAAESEVLALVNAEREKAGCSPVTPDRELAGLAQSFSEDMAGRAFFSHTDPDGTTPWDRAEKRGISGLGGENIARGQSGAEAVMDAWMDSPGHRANILNCEYRTLGVGAHFADGGPWWTQDFGY